MIPSQKTLDRYRARAAELGLADKVDAAFAAAWSADRLSFDLNCNAMREIRGLSPVKTPHHSHAQRRSAVATTIEPLPRSKWPRSVRVLAWLQKPADRGVGDTVERELGAAGDAYKWFWDAIGWPCGCTNRQVWLNSRFPYAVSPT